MSGPSQASGTMRSKGFSRVKWPLTKGKSGSIRWGGTWSGIGPAEWAWVMGYSRLDGGREPHTGNEWLLTAWWAASIKSPRWINCYFALSIKTITVGYHVFHQRHPDRPRGGPAGQHPRRRPPAPQDPARREPSHPAPGGADRLRPLRSQWLQGHPHRPGAGLSPAE